MERLRAPLTALLTVVILVDAVIGYRLWASGWPKRVYLTSDQPGMEQIHVVPLHFAGSWLILVLLIGLHGVLLYLVWKAWHVERVRTRA
jgi:hypothetical protein